MESADHAEHERIMRAALALGRRSMGLAAPNPSVGALVVKDRVVIGRGVTAPGGRPHAEPIALAEAGDAARGATLYVTLEPCSHHGRTPPCVDAVIASGIACVVVALCDPDPRVSGRGLARLKDAGVSVIDGIATTEARQDHLGHIRRVTAGRPMLTVKMAETADGFAARAAGHRSRLMITGPAANGRVQMMRALHDAILVGGGTVREDDPLLTVRLPGMEPRSPLRIILDSELSLRLDSRLVQTIALTPLVVATSSDAPCAKSDALGAAGVSIIRVPRRGNGLDLDALLAALGRQGITRVLCEGGPHLASNLIVSGLADQVALFTAEASLGETGRDALDPAARARIADPSCYSMTEAGHFGTDRLRIFDKVETSCSPD